MRGLMILCAVLLAAAPDTVGAQSITWPTRPIRIVLAYPPSSPGDIAARKFAPWMQGELGAPIIVDNRPGANGTLAMETAANAASDGQTFVVATDAQFAIMPAISRKLPYTTDGFATIAPMMVAEMVVVAHPSLGATDLQQLAALAQEKPDGYAYGSVGAGSQHHLFIEYLKWKGRFNLLHVPYRGTAAALPDLLSGKIQVMAMGIQQALQHIRDGRLVALAVGSSRRLDELPRVPTISESGYPGFEARVFWAMWAPAATPPTIISKMRAALNNALKKRETRDWFAMSGLTELNEQPADFDKRMQADRQRWADLIRETGIKVTE